MEQEMVTIKTTKKGRDLLRLLAAQHDIKQYKVMEVLLTYATDNPVLWERLLNPR